MAAGMERVKAALARERERRPWLDRTIRMQQHYSEVNGSALAGAVTYFAFLSVFPILALAFFVVGFLARVYPDAQRNLVTAVEGVLPGLLGQPPNGIPLDTIQRSAGAVGLIGLVTLVYSGLGWVSGMRTALEIVFELPRSRYPNLVVGKLRDLVTLAVVGLVLLLTVAVSGAVSTASTALLDVVGLGHELAWLVVVLGVVLALAANTVLFFALFRLLADPPGPRRPLLQGALLGAIGFEVLKQASSLLLAGTKNEPAVQVFGIALILIVWISYFSRLVVYAAAWAHVSPEWRAVRAGAAPVPDLRPAAGPASVGAPAVVRRAGPDPRLAFGAGVGAVLALLAVVRRRRR